LTRRAAPDPARAGPRPKSAKLVGDVATAGVSAQRMHQIGRLAVAAWRPIPPPDREEDGAGATSASAAPAARPAR